MGLVVSREEMEESKKYSIVKDDRIIEAKYTLSVSEQKIILFLLSRIEGKDGNLNLYRLKIQDLADFIGIRTENYYSRLKTIISNLENKKLHFKGIDNNGDYRELSLNWLSSSEYIPKKGIVELEISVKLKPLLFNLQQYTKYALENVLQFKSYHSFRFYELCKKCQKNGGRGTFEINPLKKILQIPIDKYTRYNDFKKRIILPVQKELLNYSDVYFEFKEIKESRKIVAIELSVFGNTPKSRPYVKTYVVPEKDIKVIKQEEKKQKNFKSLLADYGLTATQIETFEKNPKITEEKIKKNLERLKKTIATYKAQGKKYNVSALAFRAIEENWQDNEEKQKQLEKKERHARDKKRMMEQLKKEKIADDYRKDLKNFRKEVEKNDNSLNEKENEEVEKEIGLIVEKLENVNERAKKGYVKSCRRKIIIEKFKMKEPVEPFGL